MAQGDVDLSQYRFLRHPAHCSVSISAARQHAPLLERASHSVVQCVGQSTFFDINDNVVANATIIKQAQRAAFDPHKRKREVPRLALYAESFVLPITPFLAAFAIELFRWFKPTMSEFMGCRIYDVYCSLNNVTYSIVMAAEQIREEGLTVRSAERRDGESR